MKEETYRMVKAVVLIIAVAGMLIIGFRWSENGRYSQYDKRMEYSPDGKQHMVNPDYRVIDTRTGSLVTPKP